MATDEDEEEIMICEERTAEPEPIKLKKAAAAAAEEEDGVVLID